MKTDPTTALTQAYKQELAEVKKKVENIELTADASEDYDTSRKLLYRLMQRAEEALDNLLNLTRESEHPRAYEVLSGLLKTTGDLSDQLMNLQKKRHQLDELNNPIKNSPQTPAASGTTNTTNNVFIGSTAELQRMLKMEEKRVIDAEANDKLQ